MKSTTLKVEGLRCNGCVERVRSRVAAQPGVKNIEVLLDPAEARVFYDPQAIDEGQLVDVIQELGYRVVDRATP